MRPHVELIQEADLCWHPAELPRGEGKASQRNLSFDEENGAGSTKLRFDSAWHRPAGYHHADTEWYVLTGEVRLGDRRLRKGAYLRAPAGLHVPALSVRAGTEVLLFREHEDWAFTRSRRNRPGFVGRGLNTASRAPGELTVVDTTRMEWMPNIYEGDQQRFLKLKLLFNDPAPKDDPKKGFVTMMCWAPPGWSDDRMVHHPVFEEAYTVDGHMDYNFGRLASGTYFFRPARVKHGHFISGEEKGFTGIFRMDGSIINWITIEEKVTVEGKPLNYDPVRQAPVIAGIPVRSRATGEWSRDGW